MFQTKSYRGVSNGRMESSSVVVGDLPVNSENESLDTFVLFCGSEFELEFPIVGFLCSVLPGGSFTTHGYEDILHLKKLEYRVARIFASLIGMKVSRKDASCFPYGILYGRKDKFLGMVIRKSISDNLFRIIVEYGC